ncbi:MAG TPA: RNA polymerase sigma factor, partial [Solirubrobacter sp.]
MSTEEVAVQDAVVGRVRVGRPLSRRGDAALVRAAQGGSADAVEELFRRHWPSVHRSAWLVVHDAAAAEDIAQEAFVSALRALDRFDRRRPLAPWLHRIVVNRAIDWSRARALRPETGADTLPEPAAPEVGDELGDELVAALADLGPEHRAVVVLRHLLGYTPGEIA